MNHATTTVNPTNERQELHEELLRLRFERGQIQKQLDELEKYQFGLRMGTITTAYPLLLRYELEESAAEMRAGLAKWDAKIEAASARLDEALEASGRWRITNHVSGLLVETAQQASGYTTTIRMHGAPAHLEVHTGVLHWLSRAEAERGHHQQCVRLWGLVLSAQPPLPELLPGPLTEAQRVFLMDLGLGMPDHLDELGDDALDLLREHEPRLRAELDAEGLVIDGTFPGPPWARRAHHDLTMLIRALEARAAES